MWKPPENEMLNFTLRISTHPLGRPGLCRVFAGAGARLRSLASVADEHAHSETLVNLIPHSIKVNNNSKANVPNAPYWVRWRDSLCDLSAISYWDRGPS